MPTVYLLFYIGSYFPSSPNNFVPLRNYGPTIESLSVDYYNRAYEVNAPNP